MSSGVTNLRDVSNLSAYLKKKKREEKRRKENFLKRCDCRPYEVGIPNFPQFLLSKRAGGGGAAYLLTSLPFMIYYNLSPAWASKKRGGKRGERRALH